MEWQELYSSHVLKYVFTQFPVLFIYKSNIHTQVLVLSQNTV